RGATEDDIHRRFAHFVGKQETVTGWLHGTDLVFMLGGPHFLRGSTGISQTLDYAIFYQLQTLARRAFSVVGRAGLQRVGDVIPDVNVVAKQFGSDSLIQE